MQKKSIAIAIIGVICTTPALADHNSKWGEGWAKMPNDIHNTRIETRGDNTTFRDFVRQGNGAASENRYATTKRGVRATTQTAQRRQTNSRQRAGRRR
jgi:hypothetical protein